MIDRWVRNQQRTIVHLRFCDRMDLNKCVPWGLANAMFKDDDELLDYVESLPGHPIRPCKWCFSMKLRRRERMRGETLSS